jgi:glutamyl-tRNA(Gln) amidotransferase subunit D
MKPKKPEKPIHSKPEPGDYVEVHFGKVVYEGTFLAAPEDEKGIILLKLDSGYNIGLNKKDVLEINVLERAPQVKSALPKISQNKEKPNIAMVITGGTIANRYDSKTGAVAPLSSPEELFKFYPEMFEVANVVKIEMPFMKASEDMDYKDWQKIAKTLEPFLNDSNIKGIVITHGTDTLHYTSSALSFFIKNLNKPVVLTYSQRSSDRASSDAALNLKCATLAAISDIAEVMIVGHASANDDFCYAMPGTKVRKLHSSRRDTFKVVNSKPFAKISSDVLEILSPYNIIGKEKTKVDTKFNEKVALLKYYPGQNPEILDYYVKQGYSGIVIEAGGLGHVPALTSRNSWIPTLKRIIAKGFFVGITTQCIYGRVDPYIYSNLRALNDTGAVFLEDMLSETAFVKLGWVLGHDDWAKDKEKIKEIMLTNISHEFNDRLEE